jgi:transcriptional repressor NrdR
MNCPYCGHDDSKVIDSRDSGDGIRRRRECLRCERRFTTYERVQNRTLMVTKRDGRHEEFQRDKLWGSLTKACAKRPLPTGSIEKLAQDVEMALVETGRAEVPAETIGEMVMQKLFDLDRVAYIRYASVYRDFKDIETFKVTIDSLLEPPEPAGEPSTQLSFLEEAAVTAPRRRRGRPLTRPRPGSR